jgi:2-polyprenyl-3-methyl-5-hydroxy-6-metoxy-1,4-benzoquinol methylase
MNKERVMSIDDSERLSQIPLTTALGQEVVYPMLEFTGERFLPWAEGTRIHYEHLHRYAFAAEFVRGKRVLDLASGEGYGSYMLSREAMQVVGVEIDQQTVDHAIRRYSNDRIQFVCGSILDIPIQGHKIFDVVVCFEAIEHIEGHDKLLSEVKRLLKEDGLFIVSTPNKATYTDQRHYQNPFHKRELYLDEFKSILGSYFENVRILGQRIYAMSYLWDMSAKKYSNYREFVVNRRDKEFSFDAGERKAALYFVALASDAGLDRRILNASSCMVDVSDALINEYQGQINLLTNKINALDHSSVLIATMKFQSLIERLMPGSTRRRTLFEHSLTPIKIIIGKGHRSL